MAEVEQDTTPPVQDVEDEEDCDQEDEQEPVMLRKVDPLYCGVCGLPAEYCKWGSKFERCKPWLREHAAELYTEEELASVAPEPGTAADVAAGIEAATLGDGDAPPAASGASADDKGKAAAAAAAPVKAKQGGKKKLPAEVVISTIQRNKRKFVTVVNGLDMFEGIKINEAAKAWGKRFACGSSVVRNASNRDQVDIQGDVKYDLADILAAKPYNVPRNAIFFIEGKKKLKVRALDSDDDE